MINGIHHIGIVVTKIDDVLPFLEETFDAREIKRVECADGGQISAMVKIGGSYLELIEPIGPNGVAGTFMRTHGGGLHHVSLDCDNVAELCRDLELSGMKIIKRENDGRVTSGYIDPKSSIGIIFELTQTQLNKTNKKGPQNEGF